MKIIELLTATRTGRTEPDRDVTTDNVGSNCPERLLREFGYPGGFDFPASRPRYQAAMYGAIRMNARRRKDADLCSTPITRELDAAVMFADIVGFTGWSERHTPVQALHLLRRVYARLEANVFRHRGTLDKYTGDGLMAMFGTPGLGPRGATNALGCLMAIVEEFAAWNFRREQRGHEPIRISVGLHYGPVIFGSLGNDQRSEITVLGDTVNVANRLEALTREIGCVAAISVAAADAASEGSEIGSSKILALFRNVGDRTLKGRGKTVEVLAYGKAAEAPATLTPVEPLMMRSAL